MQTITREYKVYKFDELSSEAQDHAIEKLYDINIDYYWSEVSQWEFDDQLKQIGLAGQKYYFDLDRADYLYCDDLRVEDSSKFLKACGFDLRKKPFNEIARENGLTVDIEHFSGDYARNTIDVWYGITVNDDEFVLTKLQSKLDEVLEGFKEILKQEYEDRTSREAIIDTINANEYDFTENGELFN